MSNLSMNRLKILLAALSLLIVVGCSSQRPMATVDYVDLERFMGDWYVIASIPTFIEQGAHNPVESYSLNADGTIATTFSFNADAFDGEKKTYNPKGFVKDTQSNALWGMQFVWPIKADYRIVYLDADYQQTVIGRANRDYVWVMARSADISEQSYDQLVSFVDSLGYDTAKLVRAPHQIKAE
jgi:apolipoprotein D and lipocalin family protein